MEKIYRIIRIKKHLRRLSAVWLFMLAFGLCCPALAGEAAIVAGIAAPETIDCKVSKTRKSDFCTGADVQHERDDCADDCLCHAAAMSLTTLAVFERVVLRETRNSFRHGEFISNALAPPFEPPKIS